MLNRGQRRTLDREVKKSISRVKAELEFLNAAGNPKYKLVVQSDLSYKTKKAFEKLAFWR